GGVYFSRRPLSTPTTQQAAATCSHDCVHHSGPGGLLFHRHSPLLRHFHLHQPTTDSHRQRRCHLC
ncbi:unnamed protein product, partial [Amoebophrya sp. A120]